jgi:hypothetical protein
MPEASSNIDLSANPAEAAEVRGDIWSMTPEEATAVLAERSLDFRPAAPLAPTTARDAEQRLAQLISDPEWARKLMSGDMATRDEFQRLSELKPGITALDPLAEQIGQVETTISDTGLTRRNLISAAEDMRRDGFNEEAIYHILNDGKFTADTVATAQFWLPRMEQDPSLLYPDWPQDREYQLKCFRVICAIGTGETP